MLAACCSVFQPTQTVDFAAQTLSTPNAPEMAHVCCARLFEPKEGLRYIDLVPHQLLRDECEALLERERCGFVCADLLLCCQQPRWGACILVPVDFHSVWSLQELFSLPRTADQAWFDAKLSDQFARAIRSSRLLVVFGVFVATYTINGCGQRTASRANMRVLSSRKLRSRHSYWPYEHPPLATRPRPFLHHPNRSLDPLHSPET